MIFIHIRSEFHRLATMVLSSYTTVLARVLVDAPTYTHKNHGVIKICISHRRLTKSDLLKESLVENHSKKRLKVRIVIRGQHIPLEVLDTIFSLVLRRMPVEE